MVTFLNPSELGDATPMGQSTGAATKSLVFATGLAFDPDSGQRRSEAESVGDEVRMCWDAIALQLEQVGLTLKDVVKTSCFVSAAEHRGEFMETYKAVLEPGPYPARTTLVAGLPANCRVLIEAIAVQPEFS